MKFNIHGKKLDVTDSIKTYIEEKIGRLDKYFDDPDNITATALIKLRGNDQVVEITINANRFVLRSEEQHKDLYAAIDKAIIRSYRYITYTYIILHSYSAVGALVEIGMNRDEV